MSHSVMKADVKPTSSGKVHLLVYFNFQIFSSWVKQNKFTCWNVSAWLPLFTFKFCKGKHITVVFGKGSDTFRFIYFFNIFYTYLIIVKHDCCKELLWNWFKSKYIPYYCNIISWLLCLGKYRCVSPILCRLTITAISYKFLSTPLCNLHFIFCANA